MTETIDWDNLPTTTKVWVETTERLPEGVYACPRCEGTGRIEVGHADPGPNPSVKCGMCNGVRVIKRCEKCRGNPVPTNSVLGLCKDCEEQLMKDTVELEKRVEIICDFPEEKGICAHSEFQRCNSKGNLVCDPDSCEYANPPPAPKSEYLCCKTYGEQIS